MKLLRHSLYYKLKHYFIITLTFMFVFGFQLTFLPINSSKIVFLFLFSMFILYTASIKQPNLRLNKDIIFIVSYLLAILALSLMYVIVHQTMDFSIPYSYFIFITEALLGSYLLYKFFLKNYYFEEILHIIIVISLIQSLIILGMFTLEPFKDLIFELSGSKEDLTSSYGGFRGFGLAGSVTYDLAIFLSISMMFITYLLSRSSDNRLFYLSSWVVIFIAVLMTGRTGWIGVFLSVVILFLNLKNKNSFKSILYLVTFIVLVTIVFVYVLLWFFPEVYSTLFVSVVPYAFEMFINLYETGSMSTSSSDILQTMYFDAAEKTYLFGDGYWVGSNGDGYYMRTDAGYMRHLLFYGLLPSLLLYIFYLYGFFKIANASRENPNYLMLVIMLCMYYFIAHYKGDFLTGSSMNIKLFSIILVLAVTSKHLFKLNSNQIKIFS